MKPSTSAITTIPVKATFKDVGLDGSLALGAGKFAITRVEESTGYYVGPMISIGLGKATFEQVPAVAKKVAVRVRGRNTSKDITLENRKSFPNSDDNLYYVDVSALSRADLECVTHVTITGENLEIVITLTGTKKAAAAYFKAIAALPDEE